MHGDGASRRPIHCSIHRQQITTSCQRKQGKQYSTSQIFFTSPFSMLLSFYNQDVFPFIYNILEERKSKWVWISGCSLNLSLQMRSEGWKTSDTLDSSSFNGTNTKDSSSSSTDFLLQGKWSAQFLKRALDHYYYSKRKYICLSNEIQISEERLGIQC